jgi:hypothetical protein
MVAVRVGCWGLTVVVAGTAGVEAGVRVRVGDKAGVAV